MHNTWSHTLSLTSPHTHTHTLHKYTLAHSDATIHLHMEAYKVHRLTLMNANIRKHTILWKNKPLLAGFTAGKVWIKCGVPFDPLMMTECPRLLHLSKWADSPDLYLYALKISEPNMHGRAQTSNYSSGWHDISLLLVFFKNDRKKNIYLVSPISNQLPQSLGFNESFSFNPLEKTIHRLLRARGLYMYRIVASLPWCHCFSFL